MCYFKLRMTHTKVIHYSSPALHPSYLLLRAQAEITAPRAGQSHQMQPTSYPSLALRLHVQASVNPLLPQCLFPVHFLSSAVLHSYIPQTTLLFPTGILQSSSIHKSLLQWSKENSKTEIRFCDASSITIKNPKLFRAHKIQLMLPAYVLPGAKADSSGPMTSYILHA